MPAFLFKSARSAHTNAIISASVLYEQDHLLFSFHCRGRLGPLSLAARGCPLAFIDGGVFVQVCHQNRKPNPRGRPRLPSTALTSVSSSQRNYFRTDQASRSGDCSSDRIGRGVSPENGDWAARKPSPCLRCAVHLNEARPNVAPFLRADGGHQELGQTQVAVHVHRQAHVVLQEAHPASSGPAGGAERPTHRDFLKEHHGTRDGSAEGDQQRCAVSALVTGPTSQRPSRSCSGDSAERA